MFSTTNGLTALVCFGVLCLVVGIIQVLLRSRKELISKNAKLEQHVVDQGAAIGDLQGRVEDMTLDLEDAPQPETARDSDRFEFMVEQSKAGWLAKDAAVFVNHVDNNSYPSSRLEQVDSLLKSHRSGALRLNNGGEKRNGSKGGNGGGNGDKGKKKTEVVEESSSHYKIRSR